MSRTLFLIRSSGPSDSKNVTSKCNSFGRSRRRTSGKFANRHHKFGRTRLGTRGIFAPVLVQAVRPHAMLQNIQLQNFQDKGHGAQGLPHLPVSLQTLGNACKKTATLRNSQVMGHGAQGLPHPSVSLQKIGGVIRTPSPSDSISDLISSSGWAMCTWATSPLRLLMDAR